MLQGSSHLITFNAYQFKRVVVLRLAGARTEVSAKAAREVGSVRLSRMILICAFD